MNNSPTMVATLGEGEDAAKAIKTLQAQAEGIVEDHKQNMLRSLYELYQLNERQAELKGLQKQLSDAQSRIDAIRQENPDLKLVAQTV